MCVPSLRSIRRSERKEGGGVLMKEFFGPLPSGSTAAFALAFRPCAVSGSLRKGPDAVMRVLNVTSCGRLRQLAGRRSNGLRSSLLLVSAPARMKPGSSVDELAPLLCGSTRAVLRHSYFLPLGETVFKERLCKERDANAFRICGVRMFPPLRSPKECFVCHKQVTLRQRLCGWPQP